MMRNVIVVYGTFIAFAASVHSNGIVSKFDYENSQKSSNFTYSNSEDSESGHEGAKYAFLKDAYDKLYEESLRLNEVDEKLSAKFKTGKVSARK